MGMLARAAQIAGIDERPELIGAAAADRLASMVERRKPTLTQAPQSTLLTGRWMDKYSRPKLDI